MHVSAKVIVCIFALMFAACNTSRYYSRMRVGKHGTVVQPELQQKTSDSLKRAKDPIAKNETWPTKTDSLPGKNPLPEKNTKPNVPLLIDTVNLLPIGNDALFDFNTNRKKYGHHKPPPFAGVSLLILFFVIASVCVFFAGVLIYGSSWSIGLQNLVFLLVILLGSALCKYLSDRWRKYAYGE